MGAAILAFFSMIGRGLSAALTWLSKNPAIMITLIVIVAFVMLLVSKNHEIAGLNDRISNPKTGYEFRIGALRDALTTERNNTASLKAGLDDANNALGQLQTKADNARTAYDKIIAGQAATNTRLDGKLTNIQNAKPGADKCASALALIKGSVQ